MLRMPKKGGKSVLSEQEALANRTKDFLNKWGLKAKYVAEVCDVSPKVLSQFMNHKLALSNSQKNRLICFVTEYERRNS